MGNKVLIFTLIIILLICNSCNQENETILIKISSLNEFNFEEIETQNSTFNDMPVQTPKENPYYNEYLDHDYNDVLNQSQLPTSKMNEKIRFRKYGTLIDIDSVNLTNCKSMIEDIEDNMTKAENNIINAKSDVKKADKYTNEQYEQKEKAVLSGSKYKIIEENEDIHDAELWLWEEKEKLIQATRLFNELNTTLEAVKEECVRLGIDKNEFE